MVAIQSHLLSELSHLTATLTTYLFLTSYKMRNGHWKSVVTLERAVSAKWKSLTAVGSRNNGKRETRVSEHGHFLTKNSSVK